MHSAEREKRKISILNKSGKKQANSCSDFFVILGGFDSGSV